MAEADEKGVKVKATRVRSSSSRWSDNDLDQLSTATTVALGACADLLAEISRLDDNDTEAVQEKLDFLRKLAQEVQRLGIPF